MKLYRFYTLEHPVTGEIKYVGQTEHAICNRKAQHKHQAKTGNSPVHKWIQLLVSQGLSPVAKELEVIITGDKEAVLKLETYWIYQLSEWGFTLTNTTYQEGPNHCTSRVANSIAAWQKTVYQYHYDGSFVAKYTNAREADRLTGISYKDISLNCLSKRKSAGGFVWSFTSQDRKRAYRPLYSNSRTVYQYSFDGKLIRSFKSVQEAADTIGTTNGVIAASARGGYGRKSALGYKWSYELLKQQV